MRMALLLLAVLAQGVVRTCAQEVARLLAEGDSLMKQERFQRALERFDQAVRLTPDADTYAARARAQFALDRTDRFLQDTEQALKADSTHAEANYHRALYGYLGEDHRAAVRYASRGLRYASEEPLRSKLYLLRGQANTELFRHQEAVEDLRRGMERLPDDIEANKSLARSLEANDQLDAALTVLRHLAKLEPRNLGHLTNRGFVLSRLGRYQDAVNVLDSALTIDKDEPVALSNRAFALLQLGRNDEALKDVERSLRSYPANAYALRTRALLRLRKGDLNKACADLSLARILGGVPEADALFQEHCGGMPQKR